MRIAVSRRRRLGHRETHLSLRTVARLLTVLTDSYSGDVEEHYLNYATYLLLQPSHGTYAAGCQGPGAQATARGALTPSWGGAWAAPPPPPR